MRETDSVPSLFNLLDSNADLLTSRKFCFTGTKHGERARSQRDEVARCSVASVGLLDITNDLSAEFVSFTERPVALPRVTTGMHRLHTRVWRSVLVTTPQNPRLDPIARRGKLCSAVEGWNVREVRDEHHDRLATVLAEQAEVRRVLDL